jgi:hypothetical protein
VSCVCAGALGCIKADGNKSGRSGGAGKKQNARRLARSPACPIHAPPKRRIARLQALLCGCAHLQVEELQACCPFLLPNMSPRGYQDEDLLRLVATEGAQP